KIPDVLGPGPIQRRRLLDLHQANFTGAPPPIGMKARFLPDDGFDQQRVDMVTMRGGVDLRFEFPALPGNEREVAGSPQNAKDDHQQNWKNCPAPFHAADCSDGLRATHFKIFGSFGIWQGWSVAPSAPRPAAQ